MKQLVLATQAEYGSIVIAMEVMPDHVHLLLDADPREGILGMVANITG
jgi:putative transposase